MNRTKLALNALKIRACSVLSVAALAAAAWLSPTGVNAQSTTINTNLQATSGYTGGTSTGTGGTKFITFVIENNSGTPIVLTDVGNWTNTSHNGQTSELYYSATSLSGTVGTLPTATGWNLVHTQTVAGITATGVNPVNTGMNFQIPNNTAYRFAILTTGTNFYSSSGAPNNFTASGVSLYTGNYQIGGQNVGFAATLSPRYFTGFITFEPAITSPDNAGIKSLISPFALCPGNHPVIVELKNGGTAPLTKVDIDWTLDNIAQPTVSWTGNLATTASTNVTLNPSVPFGAAVRNIKVWTTMPNGIADTINTDDTLAQPIRSALSGTYVIGPAGDFPTVVDAADALNTAGVCGPVIMNIVNGTYTGQVQLLDIIGASSANTITFKSQSGNPNSVIIEAAPTGTGYVFQMNNSSYITLQDVTVQSTTSNAGRVIEFVGAASHDNIVNCTVNSTGTGASTNSASIYGTGLKGSDITVTDNTVNGGYYGIYLYGESQTVLLQDVVVERNKVNNVYLYSAYLQHTNNLKFRNNIVRALNAPTTQYGFYGYYCDGAVEVTGNDIKINGAGTTYGFYIYYNDGTANNPVYVVNNTIAIDCGSSTGYGIYTRYGNYNNFANNSVSVNSTSTSSYTGYFYYNSTAYKNNNIINNVFYNVTGAGYPMYVYSYSSTYNNYFDYNNIYGGTDKLVEAGTPAATYNSLAAWNTASGYDINSISYNPGFMGLMDLRPDPSNPASWSLNGRALHHPLNGLDKDNVARPTTRQDGVPDIGAYEFNPEVEPPLADANPIVADMGDIQVFTFGQREVARIAWGTNAPTAAVEVKQYSGRRANGIAAAAAPSGSMYFYTDIIPVGNATAFDMEMSVDYMDIWLGDIATEANLRMAHKVGSYPWMVYNSNLSSANTTTNTLNVPVMSRFGSYTGVEDGAITSAFVYPVGKNVICIGDTTLLRAEPANGTYYKWYRNGQEIVGAGGATNTTYRATLAGQYAVAITYASGTTIESFPVVISTIAPPNAVVTANGNLTYCTGNGLTLNAGNVPGVAYQWLLNGNPIAGATGNTHQVAQAGDYTVLVENIGCASMSSVTPVTSGPLTVTLGNDTSYCEVKNVFHKLDAGYPGAKYTWSTGDTSRFIEVRQSGVYKVKVDAGPNCIDEDEIQVTISPLPEAQGISFVQSGNTYTFYPAGPIGVTGFMWIFSDGSVSTQQNPVKTINGDLYVRLVLFNACGTDTLQLGWPLSVTNTDVDNVIEVYPNPAKDKVTVSTGTSAMKQLEIINSVGTRVYLAEVNKNMATVDVSNLATGNYLIRVTTDSGIITNKIQVHR